MNPQMADDMLGIREDSSLNDQPNLLHSLNQTRLYNGVSSILIADEDPGVLAQLSYSFALCAKHYNVYTTQTGKAAAQVLKTCTVNILLTALNVPVMRNFELIYYTKYYYPDTKIFAMSEKEPREVQNILDDSKVNGYIRKPLSIELIYSTLRI